MKSLTSLLVVLSLSLGLATIAHADEQPMSTVPLTMPELLQRAHHARTTRRTGIALIVIGSALTIAGSVAMAFVTLRGIFDENGDYTSFDNDLAASSASLIVGQGAIIAGSVLMTQSGRETALYLQTADREPAPLPSIAVHF